jgi:DNA-binding CsgD family transcriptional regulator
MKRRSYRLGLEQECRTERAAGRKGSRRRRAYRRRSSTLVAQRIERPDAAEAILVEAVAGGHSLDSVPRLRGVAVSTIRQRMRSVLGKTGCHRQAELVRLVVSTSSTISASTGAAPSMAACPVSTRRRRGNGRPRRRL